MVTNAVQVGLVMKYIIFVHAKVIIILNAPHFSLKVVLIRTIQI